MRLVRALLVVTSIVAPSLAAAQAAPPTDYGARFRALAVQPGLSDSARLHQLFALDWEYRNVTYPEFATYTGYPGQNDRWTDYSAAAIRRRQRVTRDMARVVEAIDRERLGLADRLSYDLYARDVRESIEGHRFPSDLLAVNQLDGPQYLSDVLMRMPAATAGDYENIVVRLEKIPAVIEQATALLDSGLALGVTPPRVTLAKLPAQVDGLIPEDPLESPLLAPFTKMPAGISAADRQRLTDRARRAYASAVRPAYRRLHDYLATTYIPGARQSLGASELPDGEAWYAYNVRTMTTTDRPPAEIHRLGLAEVRRIRAQMDSIIRSTGFTGDFAAFTHMLRTDPRFYYADSASLVQAYRDIAKRIDPELTKLFGTLPRLPYGVTTIPSYAAPSQTTAYYQPGSPRANRPGYFYVNTYKLDTRPKWEMEALTAHEAMPGHHLQIALAQEIEDVPEFRRHGRFTAFVEGWALYSESLGPELGLYEDPYSKFGQLTYEMWRAIRLVLDTGIHGMGWTRDSAIAYFTANSAKTAQDIAVEVDRYIVWPGQALAYKLGELEIKGLRQYAEQELGDRFDIRDFHDEVLGQGALPLDVLSTRIRGWVAEQKKQVARTN